MKSRVIGLIIVGVLFVGAVLYTLFEVNNRSFREPSLKPNPKEIQTNYTASDVWGKYYPKHWQSFLRGKETGTTTKYGGNSKTDKFIEEPYLKKLYAGTGYAEEHYKPRGHFYAIEDVGAINPKRTKTGGACLSCKASEVPDLIKKYGVKFYSTPFKDVYKLVKHPVGCSDCHDPKTNQLRITRQHLIDAYKRQGKDITKVSQEELRSLVCAQCHVNYYFKKDTKETTLPWDEGLTAQDMWNYFEKAKFTEWEHPESNSPLLKARHPDYELYQNSTHQSAKVACADCHMPYMTTDDVKITSHWFTSPLMTISESCTQCHEESKDYLKKRVYTIQDRHHQLLKIAGEANVKAIDAIKAAAASPGVDQGLLNQARLAHRKAQWDWDYVSTANGMGFHNPGQASVYLGQAIDEANQAVLLANQAKSGKE